MIISASFEEHRDYYNTIPGESKSISCLSEYNEGTVWD